MSKPLYQNHVVKIIGAIAIIGGLFVGLWWYYSASVIQPLDLERDKPFVMEQFTRDVNWLREPAAPADVMWRDFTKPGPNNRYGADVHTVVLFEGGKQAGFASYIKKSFNKGQLLFLSVAPEFRRKGYGEKLAQYAIDKMWAMGLTRIYLITRLDNPALRIYKRLGFKPVIDDGKFVELNLYKK